MCDNESECPGCGAINDVSEVDNYELVKCHGCKEELEFVDGELIPDEL